MTGQNGQILTAKNAWGYDLPTHYQTLQEAVPGNSLTLTIDAKIQHWLESALSAAVQEHHVAERGVGIVMDVQTGAVLAMSCQPDYDPNTPRRLIDDDARAAVDALTGEERSAALQKAQQAQWRNKAISDLYEPGSVFKLITAAAALDSGACKPTDYFVCAGKISVAGTRFRCANGHVHGAEFFRTRAGRQLQPLLYPDRRTAWKRTILRLFCRIWLAGGYWHRPARRDQAQRILYSRPDGSGKRFCIRKRTRIYLIFWLKCSIMKAKKMGHGGDYEIT